MERGGSKYFVQVARGGKAPEAFRSWRRLVWGRGGDALTGTGPLQES